VHKYNLCTLLALAVIHDLEIHQMDLDMVFLDADFKEEIYITQPEVFINKKTDPAYIAPSKQLWVKLLARDMATKLTSVELAEIDCRDVLNPNSSSS